MELGLHILKLLFSSTRIYLFIISNSYDYIIFNVSFFCIDYFPKCSTYYFLFSSIILPSKQFFLSKSYEVVLYKVKVSRDQREVLIEISCSTYFSNPWRLFCFLNRARTFFTKFPQFRCNRLGPSSQIVTINHDSLYRIVPNKSLPLFPWRNSVVDILAFRLISFGLPTRTTQVHTECSAGVTVWFNISNSLQQLPRHRGSKFANFHAEDHKFNLLTIYWSYFSNQIQNYEQNIINMFCLKKNQNWRSELIWIEF